MIKLVYCKDDFNVYRLNQDDQNNFVEILITENYNFDNDERPILTANINYKTKLIFMVNPCRAYSFSLHDKYVEVLNAFVEMFYKAYLKAGENNGNVG